MAKKMKTIDGNTAATHVAYAMSDAAAIYPVRFPRYRFFVSALFSKRLGIRRVIEQIVNDLEG